MATVDEIAPDVYRISIYAEAFDLQFNHFVVRDDEPLLYHTGMRKMFPEVREALSKLLDPKTIRYIGWSHFEVDECGALNEWLEAAPSAVPVCSVVGALVNISDFANRPPRGLQKDDVLATGKHRFRFISTPHLPHGWDAGSLFEETNATLFCSDLFHQIGKVEPVTESDDILGRTRKAITEYQAGPLMDYLPYTKNTKRLLHELADLEPKTLAIMHGSSYKGNCKRLLSRLDPVLKEVYGE
jgi:flavorubredoxin